MSKVNSICVFGDSTSWGAWDLEKGGWVNRLWLHLADQEHYTTLFNLGIDGGTTETILTRFDSEAKARKADALIFQTGGNDSCFTLASTNNRVSIEDFRTNIKKIIKSARNITGNIVFMDLKNCDELKTLPVSWSDMCYSNEQIRKYSLVMQEVCKEEGVLFLDIAPLEMSDFEDGLHPNAVGHEKISMQVKNFLLDQGWI